MSTSGFDASQYGPEVRRGGGLPFGQFVSQWACDPRYSTNLRTLYPILITYADTGGRDTSKGRPWRRELAAQLGKSVKTLDRTLLEGECAGLWRIEHRPDPSNPTLNDANIYHLRDADFWRGEWSDPLAPGQSAAEAADAVVAERVEAKRKAGIKPKGGRKGAVKKKDSEGGVTHDATLRGGGGVMGDARDSDTHDARVASPMTPNVYSPDQNPYPEPGSESRPSVPAGTDARETQADGRTDGRGGGDIRDSEQGPETAGDDPAADAAPETSAAAGAGGAAPADQVRVDASPGVDLLLSIGAWRPKFLLTGQTLRDQGLMVTGLLEAGWPREHLRQVVAGRALPDPLHRTVGAVIAGRLRAAAAMPVPSPAAGGATVPHQGAAPETPWEDRSPTPTPPTWAERQVQDAPLRRGADAQRECDGDDGLCPALAVVGETMCAACLGWPMCPGCTRRTHDGSLCPACAEQASAAGAAAIEADPTPDGSCPGHDGTPCGRAVLALGLCGRCRVAAQAERDRAEQKWRAALDRAVAAAEADEAAEPASAPF